MKKLLHFMLSATLAMLVVGCGGDEEEKLYTVPSVVTLNAPAISAANATVVLSAVYNGDDGAIASAGFVMVNAADNTAVSITNQSWKNGTATATVAGLTLGNDYSFNFVITTRGNNTVKAEKEKSCSFALPNTVTFKTLTTLTAKVLEATYNGCDEMIESAEFIIRNSSNELMTDVPTPICTDGTARILLVLADWVEDIYTCALKFTFYDGTEFTSQTTKLSMMPLPENVTLMTPVITGNDFVCKAAYDGEDKTIDAARFVLYSKAGVALETVTATFADRVATATFSGHEYAKYAVNCFLDLADGSTLSAPESLMFTHARPRTFASITLDPVAMGTAGMNTSSTTGICTVTYLEKVYEYENMYSRTSSGKTTLYTKSSLKGYLQNNTPFDNGIKTVYINNSSGKELVNFACYGKNAATDEWTEITGTNDGNQFIYDFSGDNFNFFKFATKATSELKANNFAVDYYTEPYVEY